MAIQFDNVFYDHYLDVLHYPQKKEVWKEGNMITLLDTDGTLGLFECSDIIVAYAITGMPNVITERIYKKNYKRLVWWKMRMYLHTKASVIKQELGYNISISFNKDYIDYIHFKEDWWLWAKEQLEKER